MDDFRKYQKYPFGGPNRNGQGKNGIYGCPCCCSLNVCLNKAKKIARHDAKVQFRRDTEKLIDEQITEMRDDSNSSVD